MVRYVACLLLLISLSACGPQPTVSMPDSIAPLYSDFLSKVKPVAEHEGVITLDSDSAFVSDTQQGFCLTHPVDIISYKWEIHIKESYWNYISASNKRVLIFHELTHCVFNSTAHSSDPNSYMHATLPDSVPDLDSQVRSYTDSL